MSSHFLKLGAVLSVGLGIVACSGASRSGATPLQTSASPQMAGSAESAARRQSDLEAIAQARADSAVRPYTEADVNFMTGMIAHHAQAIVMARWAPTHGASESVRTLCARIINAQQDEIVLMQQWLRDRLQPVPEAKPGPMKMRMNGMVHEMMMPGMLTDEQMKQLDAARGQEFDRLFLTFMIQHHNGAVDMVKDLMASPGAAQEDFVWKIASDISVDQTTEIARMEKMLFLMALEKRSS